MATVIDTPEGIEAYRRAAVVRGLKLEIEMQTKYGVAPTACPTRGMAFLAGKRDLKRAGRPIPRTRKKVLAAVEALYAETNW